MIWFWRGEEKEKEKEDEEMRFCFLYMEILALQVLSWESRAVYREGNQQKERTAHGGMWCFPSTK